MDMSVRLTTTDTNPCVRICVFEDEYCLGCKRSMYEVRDWYEYSEEMRVAINIDLKDRELV